MDDRVMDLYQAIDRFLIHCRVERGMAANTISAYAADLRFFVQWIEERRDGESPSRAGLPAESGELTAELITSYVGELNAERRFAASTVRRRVASLRSFLRFLTREGILEANPFPPRLRAPAAMPLPKALSYDEVVRLLEAASGDTPMGLRDRALMELLYATGMRVSECLSLSVSDVELGSGLLRVRGKGGKYRLLPMGDDSADWLRRYVNESRPKLVRRKRERHLFPGRRGPLSRVQVGRIVKRYALAAGLSAGVSPHTLRHCFATHMLERGADIRVVQELLGHSQLGTVEVYTRVTMKHLREVYDHAHPHAQ